jgi:hypothetical protein
MNKQDLQRQSALQAQAEQAERQGLPAGVDPALDRYRLVLRALRQPVTPALPADFAQMVAARVAQAEEKSSLEDWLTTLLMFGLAITGLVFVAPVMAGVIGQLHFNLPSIPWPLLAAAGVSVALAWALDRGAVNWRSGGSHRA